VTGLQDRLQSALGGTYTIERELGGGGMSRVYLARETALGRAVVIKVLPPELEGAVSVERFRREISLAAQLQHPTIVPLLTAGEADGLLYYTMPFIEGTTLRVEMERSGPLPIARVERILRDVLEALSYAHARGIVHRDVKPENILLAPHHAVVSDFGVAKAIAVAGGTDARGRTTAGMVIGSPSYMAPEQAAADPATDHRADLYAVGVVGYEMLAGTGPFPGRTPSQMLAAHMTEMPPSIAAKRAEVPPGTSALIMRLLEKDPDRRPASADAALEALAQEASGGRRTALGKAVGRGIGIAAAVSIALFGAARWRSSQTAGAARPAPSIAVLPFSDESASHDQQYFSDGMSEQLIDALSRVPGLRVMGRGSSFAFRGQDVDAREIGRRLGVGAVLEGSVQRAGNRLRVRARLTDTGTGLVQWQDTYDRDVKDVFTLQDEISGVIVLNLRARLGTPAEATAPTADIQAYQLYLQGRYFWNKRSPESLQRAVEFFRRAIALDPRYARAYAGLADAYNVIGGLYYEPPLQVLPKAKDAALKAIALDPNLSEAHAALGFVRMFLDWDWDGARSELERAVALDPKYPTARLYHSYYLQIVGEMERGAEENRRALELDPFSSILNLRYGDALETARRYDEALAQYRHTFDLDSTYPALGSEIPRTMALMGDYRGALAEWAQWDAPGQPYLGGDRIYVLTKAGLVDSARRMLARRPRGPRAHAEFSLTLALFALGERDSAFAEFTRVVDQRGSFAVAIAADPFFDDLRTDPRYWVQLRRMGLGFLEPAGGPARAPR